MKKIWIAFAMMFVAAPALAQTTTLNYEYLNTTPATVATYTQATTIDGVRVTAAASCAARGADTVCTQPLPTMAPGTHTITVTATLGAMSASGSLTADPSQRPSTPTKLTITVVVITP